MLWNIVYLDSVEGWLSNLSKLKLKSVAKELKLLELSGNQLQLPHSKSLGQGLFELRERKFGCRIYYAFDRGKVVVLLHAGNKTGQVKDIRKARSIWVKYLESKK